MLLDQAELAIWSPYYQDSPLLIGTVQDF